MYHRFSILYFWFAKLITSFLPNHPIFMRLRGALYSIFMKSCGKNFQVTSTCIINPLCGLEVGDNVYIAHNTVIIGKDIAIGHNVIIGPNCVISSDNHIFDGFSYRSNKSKTHKTVISSYSWVAGNCSIVSGAKLPESSVLGAGSVLNKEFEYKRSLYAGIPACFIKKLDS